VPLQGTLDAFGLAEVLPLLAATAKTGHLQVEGDGGHGDVWVRDGAVTAASTDRVSDAPLDEVLCDLLRYQTGSFTFELDESSPEAATPENVHDLLDRAYELLAEWNDLQAVVPSLGHRLRLVEHLSDGEQVTVTAAQWPALVAVGDGCTVGDLAAALSVTELQALRVVHDLVTSGLTTLQPARPASQRTRRTAQPRLA
jgi:hypothetical protein